MSVRVVSAKCRTEIYAVSESEGFCFKIKTLLLQFEGTSPPLTLPLNSRGRAVEVQSVQAVL